MWHLSENDGHCTMAKSVLVSRGKLKPHKAAHGICPPDLETRLAHEHLTTCPPKWRPEQIRTQRSALASLSLLACFTAAIDLANPGERWRPEMKRLLVLSYGGRPHARARKHCQRNAPCQHIPGLGEWKLVYRLWSWADKSIVSQDVVGDDGSRSRSDWTVQLEKSV